MSHSKENSLYEDVEKHPINFAFKDSSSLIIASNNQIYESKQPIDNKDELFILKERLFKGYSLNIEKNIEVLYKEKIKNTILTSLWEWLKLCENYKIAKQKGNLDPLLGIEHILNLEKEFDQNPKSLTIYNYTIFETKERNFVLNMCGWAEFDLLKKEDNKKLIEIYYNLEQKHDLLRAAAIAVFHFDFPKAIDFLNKANTEEFHQYNSEIHYLKGLLRGFYNIHELLFRDIELQNSLYTDFKNPNKENPMEFLYECSIELNYSNEKNDDNFSQKYILEFSKLKSKRQKLEMINQSLLFLKGMAKKGNFTHPYLVLTLKFLSEELLENPNKILDNSSVFFYDRLGLMVRFIGPVELKKAFKMDEVQYKSRLDYIPIIGCSDSTYMQILSSYLDQTSDIQTIALLSIHFRFLKAHIDTRLTEWYHLYRDLLTHLQLYEHRNILDQQYQEQKKLRNIQNKPDELMEFCSISQKCYFCSCSLSHTSNTGVYKKGFATLSRCDKVRIYNCPDCLKPLANCAICLLPVGIFNPYLEEQKKKNSVGKKNSEIDPFADIEILNIDEALAWCQNCRHGGHYKHLIEWFMENNECPVSDCPCECAIN